MRRPSSIVRLGLRPRPWFPSASTWSCPTSPTWSPPRSPRASSQGKAFHFVIFGEKASLEDVLLPIARAKQADLYLPTGEISDTLLHQIAMDAAKDGRPMV